MDLVERKSIVTTKGKPLTLLGPELHVGDPAPGFRVVDGAFQPVRLADFAGRAVLISAVPSLDTGVCALQTKRFNDEVASLPSDVIVLTVSMDLPFAQKRFCEFEKIDRVRVLSDHVWREFGAGYGILIKDLGLLARSVFVVGKNGRIVYRQIVPEMTEQPDYEAALEALRTAVSATGR
jgi:thioredoxin-dependent peroxiredoxin